MNRYKDGELSANWIIRECIKRGMSWDQERFALTLPSGKVRTSFPVIRGYRTVTLTAARTRTWRSVLLARVICWLSHGEPPFGTAVVDHINRNKLDDSPSNLRWATPGENIVNVPECVRAARRRQIVANRGDVRGERVGTSKLDDYLLDKCYSTCYADLALNENPPD